MESPAVVGFAAVFLLGAHRATLVAILLFSLWQLHYVHRAFVYPLRARSAGTPWPLSIVALAFGFQTYNAYLNARWISHFGDYGTEWLTDPRFCCGFFIFCGGLVLNLWSDEKLRTLRKGGETGYRVPRGGAFELVSCPNYLGEILEWIGWASATWSLAGAAFAFYTIANLGPRAWSHHRWYQQRFADYPAHRRALIPYLL
jgi:steroid 5-alpha reductase family enzyme